MNLRHCAGMTSIKNQMIRIRRGLVRGVESLPKTKAGYSDIPITELVALALELMRAHPVQSQKGLVFTNKNDTVDDHMDRIWRRALKKAGLRHRPSYQLRHTA